MTAIYYAVAILPDEDLTEWAAVNRRGLACNFPVHVTVKGRFRPIPGVGVEEVVSDLKPIFEIDPFVAKLEGPVYVDKRLRWMECLPSNEGFSTIRGLHERCVKALLKASYVYEYREAGPYEMEAYRPHMTLDWNDQGIHVPPANKIQEQYVARAVFDSWAIMRYSDDYLRRGVKVVYRSTLGGTLA